jgi:hypothetical protein
MDIPGRRLLVHRHPQASEYRSIVAYSEHESVSLLSATDKPFRVADAIPE